LAAEIPATITLPSAALAPNAGPADLEMAGLPSPTTLSLPAPALAPQQAQGQAPLPKAPAEPPSARAQVLAVAQEIIAGKPPETALAQTFDLKRPTAPEAVLVGGFSDAAVPLAYAFPGLASSGLKNPSSRSRLAARPPRSGAAAAVVGAAAAAGLIRLLPSIAQAATDAALGHGGSLPLLWASMAMAFAAIFSSEHFQDLINSMRRGTLLDKEMAYSSEKREPAIRWVDRPGTPLEAARAAAHDNDRHEILLDSRFASARPAFLEPYAAGQTNLLLWRARGAAGSVEPYGPEPFLEPLIEGRLVRLANYLRLKNGDGYRLGNLTAEEKLLQRDNEELLAGTLDEGAISVEKLEARLRGEFAGSKASGSEIAETAERELKQWRARNEEALARWAALEERLEKADAAGKEALSLQIIQTTNLIEDSIEPKIAAWEEALSAARQMQELHKTSTLKYSVAVQELLDDAEAKTLPQGPTYAIKFIKGAKSAADEILNSNTPLRFQLKKALDKLSRDPNNPDISKVLHDVSRRGGRKGRVVIERGVSAIELPLRSARINKHLRIGLYIDNDDKEVIIDFIGSHDDYEAKTANGVITHLKIVANPTDQPRPKDPRRK
jgi:hypothetical protein